MQYTKLAIPAILCLLLSASARAQNQPQNDLTKLKGTVSDIASNKRCFILTDKAGTRTTVVMNSATKFILGGSDATFIDVVASGERVTVNMTSAGIAVDVTNKNKGSRMSSAELKETLGVTDEECEVLVPMIVKVQGLQQLTRGDGVNGSDIHTAYIALRAAMKDQNSTTSDIDQRLRVFRDARAKAQRDLAKARDELTSVLTLRQEGILVQMGILQ